MTDSQKQIDAIRQARAILERWQSSDLLDQIQSTDEIPPLVWSSESPQRPPRHDEPAPVNPPSQEQPAVTGESALAVISGLRLKPVLIVAGGDGDVRGSGDLHADNAVSGSGDVRGGGNAGGGGNAHVIPGSSGVSLAAAGPSGDHVADVAFRGDVPPEHERSAEFGAPALTARSSEAAGNADVSLVEALTAANSGAVAESQESPGRMVSEESRGSELGVPPQSRGNPGANLQIRRPPGRPAVQRRAQPVSLPRKDSPGMPDMNRTLRFDAGAAKIPASSPEEDRRAAAAADLAFAAGVLPESQTAATAPGGRSSGGEPAAEHAGTPVSNASGSVPGRRVRIDPPEPVEILAETSDGRTRTHGKTRQRYIDEAHAGGLLGPHFQVTVPRRSNLTSLTGQFLAYLGVLGLTVGTAIVIYGHFGGYAEYTPTGWLITTVAQMLLFLGIINLVSGGIEQNNHDVSRRINTLGEQLLRIEQVTEQALRGPKLPPSLYQAGKSADPSPIRQDGITVP